ncbi:MAG: hypothetical protein PHE51_01840 [Eubacteriales bacterium]|nr:hypothetical protein [Eubacteriales bacterium]
MKTRGVIMLVISIVFTITIGAANTPDVVKALMDESSSNIVYNDNEINFFDDNDNQLSVYTHNGLTYVPLRSFE